MRTNLNPNIQPQPMSVQAVTYAPRYHRTYPPRAPRLPRLKVMQPTISENDRNGVEIRWPSKPSDALRAHMGKGTPENPGLGWRWSKFDGCWYKRKSKFIDGLEHDISAQVLQEATELVQIFLNEMNEARTAQVEEGVVVS